MARKSSVERAVKATGGFSTAHKNIVVQYENADHRTDDILSGIREDVLGKGVNESDIVKVDVYIKPEDHKVFYVVNDDINGSIDF
ncbi:MULTISPECIES: DUF6465 family protein [unclassified Butyrivibrio]|uniref:DUF6465 family protein n=1 Tax=unclassified Butyrivibrio TaxID=2639466 RepID=UPI00041EE95F|nr:MULTISPECIES: DUF6465 family protein [unclassified Butyrivibrio]